MYVVYRTEQLDLSSVPASVDVVVVHNDRMLRPETVVRCGVKHVFAPSNLGFGVGVNLALSTIRTERVILVNPDVTMSKSQWRTLVSAPPHEIRTVALNDASGMPTSVINGYPSPFAHVLTGLRAGRLLPRGSAWRRRLSLLAGRYARANAEGLKLEAGRWPLGERWASGAVLSIDAQRLRRVGGFDPRYFLYFEDVDLCGRLASRFPDMELVLVGCGPGEHVVGASADGSGSVDRARLDSAVRYSASQEGWQWRVATGLLRLFRSAT